MTVLDSGLPVVASLAVLWAVTMWALHHRARQREAQVRWKRHIADLRVRTDAARRTERETTGGDL